ncbi:MAG: DUF4190 domain-containing protein [Lachnospirales bacterium]
MSEDYNNNQTQSENIHDEVVDNIPENTKNIDNEAQSVHSSVHIETVTTENSLMSILSLVLGIFSIICCCFVVPPATSAIIGLILGIVSLKTNKGNKTIAILGIILCSIGIALIIIFIAFAIICGSINAVFEIPATISSGTI